MPGPGYHLRGDEEIEAVAQVLRSGHLSRYGREDDLGFAAYTRRFEQALADRVGARYGIAVNSGTSALMTVLGGLNVGPGDEVIVPAYTFVAPVAMILQLGATPVLAEIDDSFTLDVEDVCRRINPKTRGIIAVHMLGGACRLDGLRRIANEHGLFLVEDCAQAQGAEFRGREVGGVGDASIFSFNVHKTLTCGDGGALATSDDGLYARFYAMHDHGHRPLRSGGPPTTLGFNFRMTEVAAAQLYVQLGRLDTIRTTLRSNRDRVVDGIRDLDLGMRQLADPGGDLATHLVICFPDAQVATEVADHLGTQTLAQSHMHTYWRMEQLAMSHRVVAGTSVRLQIERGSNPVTDRLLERSMSFGIGVVDPGLGSGFGIDVRSDAQEIDAKVDRFRSAVECT